MVARSKDRGFVFDYLYDPEQSVARALGYRDRRLVYHGAIDDNRDDTVVERRFLRDSLDAVLAGEVQPVSETPPVGCTVKWRAAQ
jgi:hypothetical protein